MHSVGWKIVLLAIALTLISGESSAFTSNIGQAAPALVLPQLDGQPFDLSAQRGKVVVLHLWATWCPACRAEMPTLEDLYRRYHADGLEMIALSADRARDKDEAAKMMRSFSFQAALLNEATTNGFGAPNLLPVTIIIGRDGVVRDNFTPEQTPTAASLAAALSPLLAVHDSAQH